MSKKVRRVRYTLDTKGIDHLPNEEIAAILRAADELIMSGGRTLLAKILKGSRARQVLELGLDQNPSYGYYANLRLEDIQVRVDWTIVNDYLQIKYDYRLPLLVYTPRGWAVERETFAQELLDEFEQMLVASDGPFDMHYLKDRPRDMILLLLDKVEATGDPRYVPLLLSWAAIDYKKVQQRIGDVIRCLEQGSS